MQKISIEALEFFYPGIQILKGISTQINKGEMIALVGPNGSGKSTLMKCINKILTYQIGGINIDGKPISDYSNLELSKKIAYVPQNEIKISGVNVFDMILTGRKPYIQWKPSENDYRIAHDVMKSLKIEHLAMKDMSEMSGGQQQMVYIARAIAQETDILLLDEPTNNLDVKHQLEIMELLKELSIQGKTIIVTLHEINLAIKYCQKYILLKGGKVFSQGGKESITAENLEKLYGVKMKVLQDNDDYYVVPYCLCEPTCNCGDDCRCGGSR